MKGCAGQAHQLRGNGRRRHGQRGGIQPMQIGNDDKYVIVMHNSGRPTVCARNPNQRLDGHPEGRHHAVGYEGQIFKGASVNIAVPCCTSTR